MRLLLKALQYGTENPWFLSRSERILINQERGRLAALPETEFEPRPVPEPVELKITELENLITKYGFKAIEKPSWWRH